MCRFRLEDELRNPLAILQRQHLHLKQTLRRMIAPRMKLHELCLKRPLPLITKVPRRHILYYCSRGSRVIAICPAPSLLYQPLTARGFTPKCRGMILQLRRQNHHVDTRSIFLLSSSEMSGEDRAPSPDLARPRKRTRRACDKCSTARARCDGDCPWFIVMHYLSIAQRLTSSQPSVQRIRAFLSI